MLVGMKNVLWFTVGERFDFLHKVIDNESLYNDTGVLQSSAQALIVFGCHHDASLVLDIGRYPNIDHWQN